MKTHFALVVLGLTLRALPIAGQDVLACGSEAFDWGFGPTVVPADGFAKHFGAELHAGGCGQGTIGQGSSSWSWVLAAGGRYLWVDRSVQIPDATEMRAAALLSWSLPSGDVGLNPGFLEFGGTTSYEASPDRREQHLAMGGELRYANNSAATIGTFIPSIVARWDLVKPTTSEARDAISAPGANDAYGRWSLRGYLNIRPRYFMTGLDDWSLVIDGSVFRANGLEQALADAGWDSGEYIAVTLRFTHRVGIVGPVTLTSVYAGYADGQLPTDFKARKALSGGLSLALGR